MGLLRLERGAAKDQRMVYAQALDAFARRRRGSYDSVVDSRWPASGPIPLDDREISRPACDTCMGSRTGCFCPTVRGCGVAGLSSRAWKNLECGEYRAAFARADDDGLRMVSHLLSCESLPSWNREVLKS